MDLREPFRGESRRPQALALIETDLPRHILLVSSARNLQECSGLQKLPDPPPAPASGNFHAFAEKREDQERRIEPIRESNLPGEQSGVRRVRKAMADKSAWDFASQCQLIAAALTSQPEAGRQAK